jgi:hypothetical protein
MPVNEQAGYENLYSKKHKWPFMFFPSLLTEKRMVVCYSFKTFPLYLPALVSTM